MKAFICASLFSLILLCAPLVFAQEGLVPCDGVGCGFCDLAVMANRILEFLVSVAVAIGGIMFAWGGLEMVTSAGNPTRVSSGKQKMTNAVIGLIIVLAAWLLIDTLLKMILDEQALGVWNEIQCN